MPTRLVVAEEAFVARGRGVLVEPRFTLDAPRPNPFPVTLRAPDGGERKTVAELEVSHVRGTLAPYAMVRLPLLGVDDVAPGTEIWTDD